MSRKRHRFRRMEKATSYLISLGIISFGMWITAAETGSPSFANWLGVPPFLFRLDF